MGIDNPGGRGKNPGPSIDIRLQLFNIRLGQKYQISYAVLSRLLEYFLQRFSKEFNKLMRGFSRETIDLMMRYHWPGNVRELRNVVERICIMHNVEQILPEHLPREIWGEVPQSEMPFDCEIPPEGIVLDDVIARVEKELVSKAFRISGGNVAKTARVLNVPRGTLRYKLEKYELD